MVVGKELNFQYHCYSFFALPIMSCQGLHVYNPSVVYVDIGGGCLVFENKLDPYGTEFL